MEDKVLEILKKHNKKTVFTLSKDGIDARGNVDIEFLDDEKDQNVLVSSGEIKVALSWKQISLLIPEELRYMIEYYITI